MAGSEQSRPPDHEVGTDQAAPLIAVKDLAVSFPPPRFSAGRARGQLKAVAGISFSISAGEAVGMVGESGCGKSTVARTLLGLQRPTSGQILLCGKEVDSRDLRPLRRSVQMVFQDPASSLNPRLKIWTQVSEPLRGHLNINSRIQRREAAVELLKTVGLSAEDAERYPHQFSGGQRQRIALARALAISPKLLVADEPVASLDVAAQAEIAELLLNLHREMNLALLLISHDLSGIAALTSRLLVIYLGKLMEEGPTRTILSEPRHPYTRALLDAAPRLDRAGSESRIVLPGDPPSPYDPPSGCVFHTRCPHTFERCPVEAPDFFEAGAGHTAACFLLQGG